MPSYFFQTFGCQMNVADSDVIKRLLQSRGFTSSFHPSKADVIVVNTCSVREHAEERARSRIIEYARKKRRGAELWVVGCMAQRLGEKLREEISGVDRVIGAREIENIEQQLHQFLSEFSHDDHQLRRDGVSDFISIMRGCNNYCSYCIVPYVRGPEHSIPVSTLVESIREKVREGVCEITLLGQNVNSYNDKGADFPDLLQQVASIEGIRRIRFTTSHPKDCSEKLIKTIAAVPAICRHVHLPVQAGADRVLSLMNRHYTAAHYLELVSMIRSYVPDADITSDILVGFPGETEDDFEETLSLVSRVQFTTAFMFAYSVREGTAAAAMGDSIPRSQKLARLNRLIEQQTAITREIYSEAVGKELEVLVSGRQEKRDRLWMGQDNGCKRVLLACENIKAGTILKARVVRSSGMTLICETV